MSTKAIIEIGPIFDYITNSRKARDLWGASFLFSYLMGKVAQYLLNNNVEILSPGLDTDALLQAIQENRFNNVYAGTIPDRLYCEVPDEQVLKKAKNQFFNELMDLYQQAKQNLRQYYGDDFNDLKANDIEKKQIREFFRLFYVYSDNYNFPELGKAAASRSRIFEFTNSLDTINTVSNKYERCQMCGDRRQVVILKNVRAEKNFFDEPLCAICVLKRGLFGIFQQNRAFPSTTRVAATLMEKTLKALYSDLQSELMAFLKAQKTDQQLRMNLIDEIGEKTYKEFQQKIESGKWSPQSYGEIQPFIDYRNIFSSHPNALQLKKKIKEELKNRIQQEVDTDKKLEWQQYLIWLERSFYTMVAMDADNLGSVLAKLMTQGHYDQVKKISGALSLFANRVHEIIKMYGGVLFYAGGEDILFMVHPAYLLNTVRKIAQLYKNMVVEPNAEDLQNIISIDKLTFSAGAYICFHKHPLKLAIKGAHQQLNGKAKQTSEKNTLAILLYKGGGERSNVQLHILPQQFSIDEFQKLVSNVNAGRMEVPRGLVYKLFEEYEVMRDFISSASDLERYVVFYYEKSRGIQPQVQSDFLHLIQKSYIAGQYDQLLHRLYFLRFLTGDAL